MAASSSLSPSSSSSVDSHNHPFYLHNNDNPGMILISKHLLDIENFSPWKRSMQIVLFAKNKIVTGTYVAPDKASDLYPLSERVNDMVISWIMNTVHDSISDQMTYLTSAAAIWKELHERFSGFQLWILTRSIKFRKICINLNNMMTLLRFIFSN